MLLADETLLLIVRSKSQKRALTSLMSQLLLRRTGPPGELRSDMVWLDVLALAILSVFIRSVVEV